MLSLVMFTLTRIGLAQTPKKMIGCFMSDILACRIWIGGGGGGGVGDLLSLNSYSQTEVMHGESMKIAPCIALIYYRDFTDKLIACKMLNTVSQVSLRVVSSLAQDMFSIGCL